MPAGVQSIYQLALRIAEAAHAEEKEEAAATAGVPVTRVADDRRGELLPPFLPTAAVQRIVLEAAERMAEAEAKVAQEQEAAIARALHEDEVHRHADLEEVAEAEAEAVPWSRQAAPGGGMQAEPDRNEHSS